MRFSRISLWVILVMATLGAVVLPQASFAYDPHESRRGITSDQITTYTATVVKASAGTVWAVTLLSTSTNLAELVLYDNATAASGTVLWEIRIPVANDSKHIMFPTGLTANNGITASVTNGTAVVEYE